MDTEAREGVHDLKTLSLVVVFPQGSIAALSRHIEYSERDAIREESISSSM